jgi:hypothetical protein
MSGNLEPQSASLYNNRELEVNPGDQCHDHTPASPGLEPDQTSNMLASRDSHRPTQPSWPKGL